MAEVIAPLVEGVSKATRLIESFMAPNDPGRGTHRPTGGS